MIMKKTKKYKILSFAPRLSGLPPPLPALTVHRMSRMWFEFNSKYKGKVSPHQNNLIDPFLSVYKYYPSLTI